MSTPWLYREARQARKKARRTREVARPSMLAFDAATPFDAARK